MERILVFMILSRTLSSFDYGTYQQVWLFYGLMLPLFTLGLPGSVLYFIPRAQPDRRKTVAFQTLFLLALVGFFFSLATFISAPWVANQFNNADLTRYLRIFSLYPLFSLPPKLVNLLMIAEDRPLLSAGLSVLATITTTLFLTWPSFFGLSLAYCFHSANLGALLFLIGTLLFVNRFYRGQRLLWNASLLRRQVAYSVPLGLASVLGVASKQLNKVVVSSSFSPDIYAVYANGAFEIPFIGILTGSLMTVLIPEFVKRLEQGDSAPSVWRLWNEATTKTALLLFPIAGVLFVFAYELMAVMFSPKYLDSAVVFRIYLALAVLRITQYGALLQAMGRTRLILYTSVAGLATNLALSWILVNAMGLAGPAWANVITTYLWALTYLVIICRLTGTAFSQVLPWKELATIAFFAVVAGFCAWPVTRVPAHHSVVLAIGTVTYFAVYLVILCRTHRLTISDVKSTLAQIVLPIRRALTQRTTL
jgi:O-antigen/teichoic acid export membrane protein